MIYLVQGDIGSSFTATITRENDGVVVDLTDAVAILKFRAKGSSTVLSTLTSVSTGQQKSDGVAVFSFGENDLDIAEGKYEGEISVLFPDNSVESVYEIVDFYLRADF